MAHLSFEYSANLGADLDLQGFCDHMRDVMHRSGIFPLGGIRVEGRGSMSAPLPAAMPNLPSST